MNKKQRKQWHRQKARMFSEQKGLCYYCQKPMLLIKKDWTGQKMPGNLATVEHLRHRFDVRRYEPCDGSEKRRVLACARCNGEQGARKERELRGEAMVINTKLTSWDKSSRTFVVEASTAGIGVGRPVPRSVILSSHKTGTPKTFRYESCQRSNDEDNEVQSWTYACEDMKLVIFND